VPTIDESGLAGFDGGSWQGVVMPAGTPRDIVNDVSGALVRIINASEMRERILGMGGIPLGNSPDEFAAFMKAESEKWAQVVKAANVKME
jgi:tripartite-type tricarboxylate transporter receptor subunit TctC